MQIAFTDGEMSNLQADYGQLLCAGICEYAPGKPLGINHRILQLDDYDGKRWNDKGLAKRWKDELERYDVVVTWNGVKFDVPFLNTRLEHWGLQEVKIARHKDLMYTAKFKLRLKNSKLDTLGHWYNCPVEKTMVDPSRWTMAMGGHRPSYNYIIHHCMLDLKVLAWCWEKMKHLVTEIK